MLNKDASATVERMSTIALQAHFDGKQIVLDEPYNLPANASLIVRLLPAAISSTSESDSEEAWLKATRTSDAFTFLDDPAEDLYTIADGHPFQDTV